MFPLYIAFLFPGSDFRDRRRRQDQPVAADHRVSRRKISGQDPAPAKGHPAQGQGNIPPCLRMVSTLEFLCSLLLNTFRMIIKSF